MLSVCVSVKHWAYSEECHWKSTIHFKWFGFGSMNEAVNTFKCSVFNSLDHLCSAGIPNLGAGGPTKGQNMNLMGQRWLQEIRKNSHSLNSFRPTKYIYFLTWFAVCKIL